MELSSLVSTDSRPPIERMRRIQLYAVADEAGISYQQDAPKTIMVALLTGAGIDVTKSVVPFRTVHAQDEHGRSHEEMYPIIAEHKTAGNPIDYDAELAKRAKRVEVLEEENSVLKRVEARLAKLERHAIPLESMVPWQLKRLAKAAGLDGNMNKEDMIAALEK